MTATVKSILIVDDSKLFLDLEGSFLEKSGYAILTAESGEEALEKAHKHHPDLILLDLTMPGLAGDEVCRQIKCDPALGQTPVIMITAADRQEDRIRCIRAGCDGYVTKTVNRRELLVSVARGLRERSLVDPRLPMNIKVRYAPEGQEEQLGVTLNVSANGMFIISEEPPTVGTSVDLDFDLPGTEKTCLLRGEVAWNTYGLNREIAAKGFGIRFTEGEEDTFDRIGRFIENKVLEAEAEAQSFSA